jgi:GNAT superfamily N-acetyltransferase
MWFRLSSAEFRARHGEPNRRALHALARKGEPLGVIAYRDGEPAGWCAVAPREGFPRIHRSRILEPVDDRPVWAVTCFFIKPKQRRAGLGRPLLQAAVRYARSRGARLIEGYPIDPVTRKISNGEAYHGLLSTFRAEKFREVARRSVSRPIVRLEVGRAAKALRAPAPRKPRAKSRRARG